MPYETINPATGERVATFPSATQAEVDRILDKISQQGFQSLTDSERAILQQIAKSIPPQP